MTATRTEPTVASYEIGVTGGRGVWLGLGTVRVAVLGVGLLTGVLALTVDVAPLLAAVPVLVTVCLAAARVAGRPLLEWVSPVSGRTVAAASGTNRWYVRIPGLPTSTGRDGAPVRLRLPGEFGRLSIEACPDDPTIGILTDCATRTATVVFDVCGVDRFPLLDGPEQDALIMGWGDSLAVLADTDDSLNRLQLIERADPPTLSDASYPAEQTVSEPHRWTPEIAALATGHESRFAAQWSFPRLDATAIATILSRCQVLSRTLLSARLLTRPLTVEELTRDLSVGLTGQPSGAGRGGQVGPLSRRSDWTQVRIDDRVHRSFAVTGWPTTAVGAAWLSPLLLAAPPCVSRTVSLHLERVAPAAAARVARTRRAKAVLDQSDRARLGMTSSAALAGAEASGLAMDAELAAGYRTHRLAGLVTLSADTVDTLDGAGQVLRQAAAVCRLELRPLHGQHDTALAATMPLCRLRHQGQS
jgi:hypothetical protein